MKLLLNCQDMSSDDEEVILLDLSDDSSDDEDLLVSWSVPLTEEQKLRQREEELAIKREEVLASKRKEEIEQKRRLEELDRYWNDLFIEKQKLESASKKRKLPETAREISEYFFDLKRLRGDHIVIAGKYLFQLQSQWKNDWYDSSKEIDPAILSFCWAFESIFHYGDYTARNGLEGSLHTGENTNIMAITDPIARTCRHIIENRLMKHDLQLLEPKTNHLRMLPPEALDFFRTNPGFRKCYDLLKTTFPPHVIPKDPFRTGIGERLRAYAVYYIIAFEFFCNKNPSMDQKAFFFELEVMRHMTPVEED